MSVKEISDSADMIVAGYAFTMKDDYVEVTDLNKTDKRLVIQNGDVVESVMSDEEDDLVLKYYTLNRAIMEEMKNA